jgi:hypothetical protein
MGAMHRSIVPLFVLLGGLAAVAGGWLIFERTERASYDAARRVAHSRSEIRMSLVVRRERGPIAEEEYRLRDLDGLSSAEYRGTGRSGLQVKIESLPRRTTDVSFTFGKAVLDGIWELSSKPPRGDTSTRYEIAVYQEITGEHGERRFTFTDPAYWSTAAGREYHIHLDRSKPVPDILQLQGTILAEPRYARLVADFLAFGSPSFRARVAATQARLRANT